MNRVEISIVSWGAYLVVLGLSLIIFPLTTVGLFGYSESGGLWIRIVGILSVVLGFYYVQLVRYRAHKMYRWKIAGHLFGLACMIIFFLAGYADGKILPTIVIELTACLWTFLALRFSRQE